MNTTETQLQEFTEYLIAKGYTTSTTKEVLKYIRKFIPWIEAQGIEIITLKSLAFF